MQNKKSKVLVVALIISLVAIISLGSLAWFTAKDDVTNQFNLATNFSIDVYETTAWGEVVKDDSGKTIGQTYSNLMPGDVLHKDPTVVNDGGHDEYVRLKVTMTGYDVWSAAVQPGEDDKVHLETIFSEFNTDWVRFDNPEFSSDGKSVTYTFYLNEVLTPYADTGMTSTLFKGLTIPTSLTSEQAKTMSNTFDIKIEGEAIQTENMGTGVTDKDTVAEQAYEAFALLTPST